MPPATADNLRRFWSRVAKGPGCWLWTGRTRGKPGLRYGALKVSGASHSVHRLAYEWFVGTIPPDRCVCHHCDNPLCVRPDHLFLGSVADNNRDRAAKGRSAVLRGTTNGHAKLTDDDVRTIRDLYAAGSATQDQLATRYGVARTAIGFVVRGEGWRGVGDDAPISIHSRSNSGFRGVSFDRGRGRFQVYITHEGKRRPLGYVADPIAGARLYDEHARRLHGRDARLNFPD